MTDNLAKIQQAYELAAEKRYDDAKALLAPLAKDDPQVREALANINKFVPPDDLAIDQNTEEPVPNWANVYMFALVITMFRMGGIVGLLMAIMASVLIRNIVKRKTSRMILVPSLIIITLASAFITGIVMAFISGS